MASSSSASNAQGKNYDVFISFRGADVRNTFLSHLLAALERKQIRAFVDATDLERGKRITPTLLKTIEESYVFIIIFSKNYPNSGWCLDELHKILQCMEEKKQMAVPVFYDVDPSVVQNLQQNYDLSIHTGNVEDLKLENWRKALTEISDLAGFNSADPQYKPEAKLCDEIAEDVSKKLSVLSESYALHYGLFDIDSRIADVEKLIEKEENSVIMVGIWGMGGIGKTTLAEKVFHRIKNKFDGLCFIENVKGLREKGAKHLIDQIIQKLLGDEKVKISTTHTIDDFIQRRLKDKKVLIVLDDVDDPMHLKSILDDSNLCSPGMLCVKSRIIVTGRDKQAFEGVLVKKHIYEVEQLNKGQALQLFSWRVFGQSYPQEEYKELSKKVVEYAQGLPLALVVLSADLKNKSAEIWIAKLKKIEDIPPGNILRILKTSYDGLDRDEKRILLDIACFFKGYDAEDVKRILQCFSFHSAEGINNLCNKSLTTVETDGDETDEDLSDGEYGNKSLTTVETDGDETDEDLSDGEYGNKSLTTVETDGDETDEDLSDGEYGNKSLTTVETDGDETDEDLSDGEYGNKSLTTVETDGDETDEDLSDGEYGNKSLTTVETDGDETDEDLFDGEYRTIEMHDLIQQMGQEIVVEESGKKTENQSRLWKFKDIEYVLRTDRGTENVEGIQLNMRELDGDLSISSRAFSNMSNLRFLRISGYNLHFKKVCLPDGLGFLPNSLRFLCWEYFPSRCLPSNFSLHELVELDMPNSNLKELVWDKPPPNLKRICLLRSSDLIQISNLGEALKLEIIDLGYCERLVNIGSSLEKLDRLIQLDLSECKSLYEFPEVPPNTKLILGECDLEGGDDSVVLDFSGFSNLTSLPNTICNLSCEFECLRVSECKNLNMLPKDLGNLEFLGKLDASGSGLEELPSSICNLKFLWSFDISNCKNLSKLPEDLGKLESLRSLNASGSGLKELPSSLCNLKSLESLDISICKNLSKLPEDLGKLESLVKLKASGSGLEELSSSLCNLKSLWSLDISNCKNLSKLPEDLGKLEYLGILNASGSGLKELLSSICNLKYISILDISNCKNLSKLPEDLGKLEYLGILNASGSGLKELPSSICNLKYISTLDISNCKNLSKLPEDLWKLESLRILNASRSGLKELPPSRCNSKSLGSLDISNFGGLDISNFQGLDISNCNHINKLLGEIRIAEDSYLIRIYYFYMLYAIVLYIILIILLYYLEYY